MTRVMINGVVWCKAENEILKAAVERYGKNQWQLVASLLRGKTAKQCKARWDTGLDPSIKKNEWSREEDEKLLYLRHLMPHKRHTIAMIIGRPVDQCTSRYYYLWYESQRKWENVNAVNGTTVLDSQRIGAKRETETAGTVPLNREVNDLQRLPLARARLAIKCSKKTRRFAREKQMAVIRRLKHRQHAIDRLRNERNRIVNCASDSSSEERTNSSFYDSTTKHETDVLSRCADRDSLRDNVGERISEDPLRIKRPRQNNISIELLENGEPLSKRSNVLVLPLPQYSYQKLHAFHDVQCKPGFEYTSYYNSFQQCEV